jgi:hypothetical protein
MGVAPVLRRPVDEVDVAVELFAYPAVRLGSGQGCLGVYQLHDSAAQAVQQHAGGPVGVALPAVGGVGQICERDDDRVQLGSPRRGPAPAVLTHDHLVS